MVSTKTTIAGFEFDNCLMNAAGVACMTIAELEEVKNSTAGTFVTKTATLEYRQGNPEPRYQDPMMGSVMASNRRIPVTMTEAKIMDRASTLLPKVAM